MKSVNTATVKIKPKLDSGRSNYSREFMFEVGKTSVTFATPNMDAESDEDSVRFLTFDLADNKRLIQIAELL